MSRATRQRIGSQFTSVPSTRFTSRCGSVGEKEAFGHQSSRRCHRRPFYNTCHFQRAPQSAEHQAPTFVLRKDYHQPFDYDSISHIVRRAEPASASKTLTSALMFAPGTTTRPDTAPRAPIECFERNIVLGIRVRGTWSRSCARSCQVGMEVRVSEHEDC